MNVVKLVPVSEKRDPAFETKVVQHRAEDFSFTAETGRGRHFVRHYRRQTTNTPLAHLNLRMASRTQEH